MATALDPILQDVADLAVAVSVMVDAMRPVLVSDAASRQDLQNLIAQVAGHQGDVRAIRAALDVIDIESVTPVQDAATILAGWRYERGVRADLAEVDAQLILVGDMANRVLDGVQETSHVVRRGETWQRLAQVYLGDFREWRTLRDYNRLVAADGLAPGMVLGIPRRRIQE